MSNFNNDTFLIRNPEIVSADMDGETVMMSIEKGEYIGLSGTGPFIWELMKQPISITQIIDAVHHEYEVNNENCKLDVTHFLQEFLEHGLISDVV
jgi:shikimate kinase